MKISPHSSRIRTLRILAAAVVATTGMSAWAGAAVAGPTPGPAPAATAATGLNPEVAAAMRRDLKLTDDQIAGRLRTDASAAVVEKRLRSALGARFAGAWLKSGEQHLTVAVTDPSAVAAVRAEGADATVVKRGERDLDKIKGALDAYGAKAGPAIHSWYVDVATNTVVVRAAGTATTEAAAFVRASGADPAAVRVLSTSELAPRPMYDIRGGDEYRQPVTGGYVLCSVGFSVVGGFVTAGHCGATGSQTYGSNNVLQGTFAGSSFPGNDYAWVRTNGDWTPRPSVNNYSGGSVDVAGSQEAAIGSAVCRSGRTSGWHCGTIQGRNETVNYAAGSVSGLTRSDACAEGGDSGGAWISGNQAQGTTSGGSGDCTSGGTTFFQPVNEILGAYGLTLLTTAAGSGNRLISNWNNKCIDVPGYNYANLQRLVVWDCNGGANQNWEFTGGTLRTQNNMCVDVNGASTANGAAIQLYTCNGGANQQFVLSAAGDLVNPQANKCVDITGWSADNGAALSLWDCNGGANQKWHRG